MKLLRLSVQLTLLALAFSPTCAHWKPGRDGKMAYTHILTSAGLSACSGNMNLGGGMDAMMNMPGMAGMNMGSGSASGPRVMTTPFTGIMNDSVIENMDADPYNKPYGVVSSGDGLYNANEMCTWTLFPYKNTSDTHIFFDIVFIDTEEGHDFVWVYDGPDSTYPLLGVFSGQTTVSVNTTGSALYIMFMSDNTLK